MCEGSFFDSDHNKAIRSDSTNKITCLALLLTIFICGAMVVR